MNYLKRIVLFLALSILLEGCAFYVRGGHDGYYDHHPYYRHYYYGYWR